MKKPIAILLMLCANFVLLVHAVVPHHHHDDIACFISPAEEHDHDCCDHDSNKATEQDTHPGDDYCLLNDLLAIIPDNYKQENLDFQFLCNENTGNTLLLLALIQDNDKSVISFDAFRRKPHISQAYERYLVRSQGMRAPPSC